MQMSIENALLVVHLTLSRLHTRPRRPYKARFVLQFFCVGVASNLRAVFSQCPRALPDVVTCTRYITPMSRPSCNNSDLLRSGMRFIFAFQSSPSQWQLCRVCALPLLSPAGYSFAGTRRLNAAFRAPLPGGYASQLVRISFSHRQSAFDCVHTPRRVFTLATCGVSCIRLYVYRKRTDFFQPCG